MKKLLFVIPAIIALTCWYGCNTPGMEKQYEDTGMLCADSTGDPYWFYAQDTTYDSLTVCRTWQRINSGPDEYVVTDSCLVSKNGGDKIEFKFLPGYNEKDARGLKRADVIIPSMKHQTPIKEKEAILKALARYDTIFMITMYSNYDAYADMIRNNIVKETKEENVKFYNSLIGVLHHGWYYEYTMPIRKRD